MKNLFFKFLELCSALWKKISSLIFNPGIGEDEKWLNPKIVMKVFVIFPIAIFMIVFIVRYVIRDNSNLSNYNKYDKETTIDYNQGGIAAVSDLNDIGRDDFYGRYSDDGNSTGGESPLYDINGGEGLNFDLCQQLLNKVRTGSVLSENESKQFDDCLNQSILGLTEAQKKAAKALIDPNAKLTDRERKILSDFVGGDLKNEDDIKLATALVSSDPNKRKIAKMIVNNPNMDKKTKKALLDLLDKEKLNQQDLKTIEQASKKYPIRGYDEGGSKNKNYTVDDLLKNDKLLLDGHDNLKKAKILNQAIDDIDKQIKQIDTELEQGRPEYNKILAKQLANKDLSTAEKKFLSDYSKKIEKKRELENKRKKIIRAYAKLSEKMKRDLIEANAHLKQKLNGQIIESDSFLSCNELQKVAYRNIQKKRVKKRRKLTAEEVALLNSYRNKRNQKFYSDLVGAHYASVGDNIQADSKSYFVLQDQKDNSLKLPPSLKIPAVCEDAILVSSIQPVTPVNIRILADIIDPATNKILITKNSIASGLTSTFDKKTGYITVNISSITSGPKVESVNLKVSVPGVVKLTRGEILTEAFLTQIIQSASQYIQMQATKQFNGATSVIAAVGAGAANSTSSVAQTVAKFLGQDLKSAPSIFFSPKG